MTDKALFYIADGAKYIEEAIQSAQSVIEHMGKDFFDIYLFNSGLHYPIENLDIFKEVNLLPARESEYFYKDHTHWMMFATSYLRNKYSYGNVTFMDTDTFVCAPFHDVYILAKYFDFMGVHAPGRFTTKTRLDVPASFPEFNLGFNPMNSSLAATIFEKAYVSWEDNVYGNNDQGALRDQLWEIITNKYMTPFYVLTPEYNCRFIFPFFVSREVKILHGRAPDIRDVARKINEEKGMRSWVNIVSD